MAATNLEQRVKTLEHELERVKAVNEIQNLMSKYEYLHTQERHTDVIELYAKKSPHVRVYWGDQGYWEGPDAPQRAWSILNRSTKEDRRGGLHLHPVSTPMIVVAGDGKTAKGVWITDGIETGRDRKTGKLKAEWAWATYGVDFIKEDGKWKFLRLHIYGLFSTPYDKPWTETDPRDHATGMDIPDRLKPDGPPTDDHPYDPNTVLVFKPDPPEPYETWDEKMGF